MDQIMHILAEHFVHALVSQSAEAGMVAEGTSVFEINSINGFGSGVGKNSLSRSASSICLRRVMSSEKIRIPLVNSSALKPGTEQKAGFTKRG
jgi:hypothetical protein